MQGDLHIPDSDNLFRAVHFPVSFDSGKRFRRDKFWKFRQSEHDENVLETSVVWEKYAPTLRHVHEYGRRTSARRNESPRKKPDVYCGAYCVNVGDFRTLPDEVSWSGVGMHVVHWIEGEEIAHANLLVRTSGETWRDAQITELITHITSISRGPARDTPERGGDPESRSLELPEGPLGAYRDTRSPFMRMWHLLRYHVCRFSVQRKLRKVGSAN